VRGAVARRDAGDLTELIRVLDSNNCNVALLSETWGDPAADFAGWSFLSRRRPSPYPLARGGVAIAYNDSVTASEVALPPALAPIADVECLVAELRIVPLTVPVTAVSLYMPAGATRAALDYLDALVQHLSMRRGFLLVGGDFNAHHPRWDRSVPPSDRADELCDIFDGADLIVLNTGE
jgi:exonuclease III